VDEAIRSDLDNAGMLINTMTAALQEDADLSTHLEEVASRVGEELDYKLEAKNQTIFAELYRGHPFVKIPDVVEELTTSRVITTEFVSGRGFYDILDEKQPLRDRFGEIIFRFAFTSVFINGVFSGDPHPGNYLFMDDGRVCFLDFGLVKHNTADERELLRGPMTAMVEGDRPGLRSSLEALAVLPAGAAVDEDLLWKLFVRILGPVDADRTHRCEMDEDQNGIDELPREEFKKIRRQLDFPAAVIFFMRYRRGTWSVLAHLGAERNWHRIMREILFGDAPSTEIGEAWSTARV
jgi:predicted unusual protein kinase regulating ubiquinone biosynthesis (AarF/ABC1/UbiB family)